MIFLWINLNQAREYRPGTCIRGLQLKGQRPDRLILDEEDQRVIATMPDRGRYKEDILFRALAIQDPAHVIYIDRRR